MKNYSQAKEWNNPQSFFRSITPKESSTQAKHFYGQIEFEQGIVAFSASEQAGFPVCAKTGTTQPGASGIPKRNYAVRGTVTLLDPATGKPLRCEGMERAKRLKRSEKEKEAPIARKNVYVNTNDLDAIKAAVYSKASELIAENSIALRSRQETIPLSPHSATLALYWAKYGTSFLRYRGAKDVQKRFDHVARGIAKLPSVPIAQLTLEKIAAVQRNKDAKQKLSEKRFALLLSFWDYLGSKAAIPDNPFFAYKTRNAKPKKNNGLQTAVKNATPDRLYSDEERQLNQMLVKTIDKEQITRGIVLAKDAGLDTDAIIHLTWGDIMFRAGEKDFVCIKIRSKNNGPVTNYTRPVFPFAAHVLHLAYENDKKLHPDEDLSNLNVVTRDGKKYPKADFTRDLRMALKGLGVEPASLFLLKDARNKVSAGIRFLSNTYRRKVETECGLRIKDPAAIRYLLTMSLNKDVSAANYRSFSSPEGLWKLYVAMRRVGTGLEKESGKCKKDLVKIGQNYLLTATAIDGRKLVSAEVNIPFSPDEYVDYASKYGSDIKSAFLDKNGNIKADGGIASVTEFLQVPEIT